jgi:hypothetical protein
MSQSSYASELMEISGSKILDVKKMIIENYMDTKQKVIFVYSKLTNEKSRILTIKKVGNGASSKSSNEEVVCLKEYVDEVKHGAKFTIGDPTSAFVCHHKKQNERRQRHMYFECNFGPKQVVCFDMLQPQFKACWEHVKSECQYLSFTVSVEQKIIGMVSTESRSGKNTNELAKMLQTSCFATKIVKLPQMKDGKLVTYNQLISNGKTTCFGVQVAHRGRVNKRKQSENKDTTSKENRVTLFSSQDLPKTKETECQGKKECDEFLLESQRNGLSWEQIIKLPKFPKEDRNGTAYIHQAYHNALNAQQNTQKKRKRQLEDFYAYVDADDASSAAGHFGYAIY